MTKDIPLITFPEGRTDRALTSVRCPPREAIPTSSRRTPTASGATSHLPTLSYSLSVSGLERGWTRELHKCGNVSRSACFHHRAVIFSAWRCASGMLSADGIATTAAFPISGCSRVGCGRGRARPGLCREDPIRRGLLAKTESSSERRAL